MDGVEAAERGPLRRLAVLPRHHGRDQRAHHPALRGRRDGDHAQLPRRAGDPPRHQGRPVGRLQGRHAAVHPAARPVRGDRAHRLRRRRDRRRSTRTRRARSPRGSSAARSKTVAVCFVNAYANPVNEIRMREILEEELPGVFVSTSSETLPEIFEFERFSTTVANAVLSPLVSGLRRAPRGAPRGRRLRGRPAAPALGRRRHDRASWCSRFAGRIAASGIAAGAIACRHIAGLCGFENAIGLDMGGTSTDISLVYEGEMRTTNEWAVEYGHPICFPSIEILTIGAGGGSLAWIDPAGSLRNGPQSAGADPGPGVLPRGGEEPTNTDANVVLGSPGRRAGRRRRHARRRTPRPTRSAASASSSRSTSPRPRAAILRVANANMADAVRLISIRRGYDPREFALVVFGGAGALHGAALAKELGIPTVLVPPNPGITSALGCLLVDVRHDLSEMYLRRHRRREPGGDRRGVRARWRTRGAQRLDGGGGRRRTACPSSARSRCATSASGGRCRWRSTRGRRSTSTALVARFHDEHEREFAYQREDGAPVEIYQLALRAVGVTPKPELTRHEPEPGAALPEPVTRRPVHFDEEDDAVDTPVYDRDVAEGRHDARGPGDRRSSSTRRSSSRPGSTAEVDEHLIIRMTIAPEDLVVSTRHAPRLHAGPGHVRGPQERVHHHGRPHGRADPAHVPLVRHLRARLLLGAVRRARATRSCRAARTSPCTSGRCTSRPRP